MAQLRAIAPLLLASSLVPSARAEDTVATPASADEVHVMRVGPGCLGGQWNSVNVAGALFDPLARGRGSYVITSVSESAIERAPSDASIEGGAWLFPEAAHVTDAARVVRVVGPEKGGAALTREVIDDALPILIGPQDMAFQWPRAGHTDVLAIIEDEARRTGGFADLKRVRGRLVRYTRGDTTALGVELGDSEPRAIDDDGGVLGWDRRVIVTGVARVGDDEVTLYAFGRRMGEPARVKAALDALVQKTTRGRTVLVHMGNVAGAVDDEAGRDVCADELKKLGLDAVVPRARDLALGRSALDALRTKGAFPFIAANLTDKDGKRPYPRSVVVEREGLTIGIVGVVNPKALAIIPSAARADWKIDPAPRAIEDALRAMREKLRRFPDLTIVMGAYAEEEIEAVFSSPHVDVVLNDDGNDIIARTTSVAIDGSRGGREMQRGQSVSLVATSPSFALSHVTARFEGAAANERKKLVELVHDRLPMIDGMAKDEALARRMRVLEEKAIARNSVILIPDPDAFIRTHPELEPLVYGEHVLYLGELTRRDKTWSPFITDALWMQLVVNVIEESTRSEVVLARNLPRGDDVLGPIPRFVIENWLSSPDGVMTTTLTGAELQQIAARIAKQANGGVLPADTLFAAGLDAKRAHIGGRPINASERYTVSYTESVAALPELADLFRAHEAVPGKTMREIVMARLEGQRVAAETHALFLDRSGVLTDKLTLGFEELSLQGMAFRNSDNIALFAAARETRASNPNLYQVAVKANGFFLYDGPWLANEWRLKVQLDSIVFDIPGAVIPPQEQRDDVVASTELRVNKVKVGIADDDFQVIPFVQAAFDTEVTATQDPGDPTKTLPHQLVLRESAGLVAYPGPMVRELRLGGLVQQDFSEAGGVHNDFGVVAAYKIRVPLVWQLLYDSELDLRYLVPDADDRPSDLALRVQSTHKIVLPLSQSIAFFVFVDAFVVTGKTAANSDLGWNGIVGAGMQFVDMWKL